MVLVPDAPVPAANERIAIVGIGLRYPDAATPDELWENVLAGRRAFRRRPEDLPPDPAAPDSAAPDPAEPAHLLGLNVAASALADAWFPDGEGLPRRSTGVVVGDSLAATSVARGIAGYFGLGGRVYHLDGAWTSSLLSVAAAAAILADGTVDVAIAGGVDLPWAGLVVLMRERDALARRKRVYASITGCGVATDGVRAVVRPADEFRRALRSAYEQAGVGPDTVSYFEGLRVAAERSFLRRTAPGAAFGSVGENIGRAGGAEGIAGLIKTALSVHHQVIPPGTGHDSPDRARQWPASASVRAAVSATSAGGISTHVVLEEAPGRERRTGLAKGTVAKVNGRQDTELLLVDAPDVAQLREQLTRLAGLVPKLTHAELADLAAVLARRVSGQRFRAALVVTDPHDAGRKLARLLDLPEYGPGVSVMSQGAFLAGRPGPPKIAYLFPGQGCGRGTPGAIRRRFTVADNVFTAVPVPSDDPRNAACAAQHRVVANSVAALRVLETLGIGADIAVGHSLGELTALSWAGAMDGAQLLRLAADRGRSMDQAALVGGGMASLATGAGRARQLIEGGGVVIAAYNSPRHTVISGMAADLDRVCARAESEGVGVARIEVSHAFHSPLVRPVGDAMAERLAEQRFAALRRPVVSTVTGDLLDPAADLRRLLREQLLRPVRFHQAATTALADVDLAIEVGPGSALTGLLGQIMPGKPVLSVNTDELSLSGLLAAVGAAYALGLAVDTTLLFAGRVLRPLPAELAAGLSGEPSIPDDAGLGRRFAA